MNRPISSVIEGQKLVSAGGEATVTEAARLMRDTKVAAILVLRKDRVAGIFTERDAIVRVIAAGLDPARTRLDKVMTRDPVTIAPDKPFAHALVLMRERGFRHVPVVDGKRPVGMVSIRDALGIELEELEVDLLQRERVAEILA